MIVELRDGRLWMLARTKYGLGESYSSDQGRTWSEPVLCMPGAGYYVTNNDRIIRLGSGRLVVPAALTMAAPCQ